MKKYGFGVDIGGTTCKIGLFETDVYKRQVLHMI